MPKACTGAFCVFRKGWEQYDLKVAAMLVFTYDERPDATFSYYYNDLQICKRHRNAVSDFSILLHKFSLPLITKLPDVLVEGVKLRVPRVVD